MQPSDLTLTLMLIYLVDNIIVIPMSIGAGMYILEISIAIMFLDMHFGMSKALMDFWKLCSWLTMLIILLIAPCKIYLDFEKLIFGKYK